ncbi:MAG: hypothetical protein ACRDKX_08680, partial [Solirubrobacterales bacterium]
FTWARARVSAALRAERLRFASLRLRVAAAFCAATLRWLSVWVAIFAHLSVLVLCLLAVTKAVPGAVAAKRAIRGRKADCDASRTSARRAPRTRRIEALRDVARRGGGPLD